MTLQEENNSSSSSKVQEVDKVVDDDPPKQAATTTTTTSASFFNVQEEANRLYRGRGLAPMVRAGTIPLRIAALEYGANFVYTEELVDRSLSETMRVEHTSTAQNCDKDNGTTTTTMIDYVKDISTLAPKVQRKLAREGRPCLLLRIDPTIEAGKLICQLGTGEPHLAVQAAKHIYKDVAGIDINMGCPKKFSVSGGMGSALLHDAPRACAILQALRREIPRPISCKIRLLSAKDPAPTIALIRRLIQEGGANAIAIHARTVGQESTLPAHWNILIQVLQTLRQDYPDFPFLMNGDFYEATEIQSMMETTGATGVLLGRPAMYNLNLFHHHHDADATTSTLTTLTTRQRQRQRQDSKLKQAQRYLELSARYSQHYKNAKYVLCEMMNARRTPAERIPHLDFTMDPTGNITIGKTCSCQSFEQIFELWGVQYRGIGKLTEQEATEAEPTKASIATTPTVLEPGEHRYEDSYFLQHEPAEKVTTKRPVEDEQDEQHPKRPKTTEDMLTQSAATTVPNNVEETTKEA